MTTYYKVISKDGQAKDGGKFDYTKYLPKNDKPGKWLPKISDIKECEKGYHITPYWNMFISSESDLIFEVETRGLKSQQNTGVIEKAVCESIRFTKRFVPVYDTNSNTGNWNTGDRNTGDWNTGCRNPGDRNTGNWNTGDRNTGDLNTGDRNTGNWNTGDRNTGCRNTGCRNTGNWNTGDWNTGNRNTGYLNTGTPPVRIFNKETSIKADEIVFPVFFYFELSSKNNYKQDFKKSFLETTKEDVEKLLKLPNFDYAIFEQISSISKKDIMKKLGVK